MENSEYMRVQSQLLMMANLVEDLPILDFIEKAERSNTISSIVNPTLWMKGHESLDKIIELARSLKSFQDKVLEMKVLQ